MQAVHLCDGCYVDETVTLCREHNLGIEVQSFYDPTYLMRHPDAVAKHIELIREISGRSFHGAFGDLCAGSFDVMVRDLARYRFQQSYDIASQLGISHLILHHGYVPGTSHPDGWIKRVSVFWREFLADKPDSLRVHLENHLERDVRMFADVIDAIGDSRVDVCLDVGHVHCNARQDVSAWVETLGTRIGYVHLHDNNGSSDEHLGFGRGTIPMDAVCAALEQHAPDAIWALETENGHFPESIQWLKAREYL
ncbi:MAG: sugar phosphate isomerase/epimerase [candidate division Zixibacteria bacterium]|nr:sugar phosphate isomerase/epimerase [candidate division Zixibacteria bacterium]